MQKQRWSQGSRLMRATQLWQQGRCKNGRHHFLLSRICCSLSHALGIHVSVPSSVAVQCLCSVRAQQMARYKSLNMTPSDDNFQSVFRAAPNAAAPEPAPEKADRWSITYEDICAAALPADGTPAADVGQQPCEKAAGLPVAEEEGNASQDGNVVEHVRAHGGRHRRNASRDEGGFEDMLRPLSLPCTPARDNGASEAALTEGCLSGSDISADEVSDDGSTSLEDMSDGEILTSSPPLALPRPAPKSRGDPRLSLRLYKLVSRSVPCFSIP